MQDTLARYLTNVSGGILQRALRNAIGPAIDRLSSQATSAAGLVIKAGGGTLVKTGGSATNFVVDGVHRVINSATDMPALVGNINVGLVDCRLYFFEIIVICCFKDLRLSHLDPDFGAAELRHAT